MKKDYERLLAALDARGIKKYGRGKKVAEATDYSESRVSEMLSGRIPMTGKFKTIVCSKFNISEEYVSYGTGEMFSGEPDQEYRVSAIHRKLTPDEEELLRLLEKTPGARETMEVFLQLPERKQKIYLGKMLEDLEKLEEK